MKKRVIGFEGSWGLGSGCGAAHPPRRGDLRGFFKFKFPDIDLPGASVCVAGPLEPTTPRILFKISCFINKVSLIYKTSFFQKSINVTSVAQIRHRTSDIRLFKKKYDRESLRIISFVPQSVGTDDLLILSLFLTDLEIFFPYWSLRSIVWSLLSMGQINGVLWIRLRVLQFIRFIV